MIVLSVSERTHHFVSTLSRRSKRAVLLTVDVILAPTALFVTFALLENTLFPARIARESSLVLLALCGAAALVSITLRIPQIKLNAYEMQAMLKTGIFAGALASCYGLLTILVQNDDPGAAIILFGMVFFVMSVTSRFAMLHILLYIYRQGRQQTRVLIYGAGKTGMQLAAALKAHESVEAVAFIDDSPALQSLMIAGLPVYSPSQLARIAKSRSVSRVLLAMPSLSAPKLMQITKRLQHTGLDVLTLPSFAQLVGEEELVGALEPVSAGQFLGRERVDVDLPNGCAAYVGRSILVTGAGGSIGSELCRQLLACHPKRLVLYEISEFALYTLDKELRNLCEHSAIEIISVLGSVMDPRILSATMKEWGVQVVFHTAAYKHVPLVEANPLAGLANNVLGTQTVAEVAHDAGVGSFILISTDKAVRPTNVMGASKRMAEMIVQDMASRSKGTVFSMVRFGNVLGSSGSVIPLFREQIARGGPVTVTHDDVTRYFMTMSEAARLVLLAGSFARGHGVRGGDVFVLDMGKPVRIRELARQMIVAAGYTVCDAAHPDGDIEIVITGLRPGEKLHEELLIGEGLLTTPHPKILRAQEACLSEIEVAGALRALRAAVTAGDAVAARAVIHRWVEGYSPALKVGGL